MTRKKSKQNSEVNGKNGKGAKRRGNPELIKRLEYLQEISQLMASEGHPELSASYGKIMKSIGKKSVWRLEPKVKRNFCKHCSTALDPNKTCEIEIIKPQNPKIIPYINSICKTCGTIRKFILDPKHKLWDKNPSWILEMYKKHFPSSSSEAHLEVAKNDKTCEEESPSKKNQSFKKLKDNLVNSEKSIVNAALSEVTQKVKIS